MSTQIFESIGRKAEDADAVHDHEEEKVVDEIESLCMNCHENGTTRLLLTRIPYFREVVIMSFSCDHCGFQNNEMQPAGSIAPRGSSITLRLTAPADLARTVIKADTATAKFIELDIEIPAGRGQITNVEGLLTTVLDDLEMGQEDRQQREPEVYTKLKDLITQGRAMLAGETFPFRVTIDDPAGNSFIAVDAHDGVGKVEKREYPRTAEQNAALGLSGGSGNADPYTIDVDAVTAQGRLDGDDGDIVANEVYSFPATCPGCSRACTTHMKMVDIPHFKQVVLMSTACHACGYRSNEVKTGGAVPDRGKKITLKVRDATDLARDILKSESCALDCPELNLHVTPGTLGGRFTTVEGLLTQIRNDLRAQIFQLDGTSDDVGGTNGLLGEDEEGGDSLIGDERSRWRVFFRDLDMAINGDRPFTLLLTDPLASSYVQSFSDDPGEADQQIAAEDYDRTEEEEEELGLKDMRVEGYSEAANGES